MKGSEDSCGSGNERKCQEPEQGKCINLQEPVDSNKYICSCKDTFTGSNCEKGKSNIWYLKFYRKKLKDIFI